MASRRPTAGVLLRDILPLKQELAAEADAQGISLNTLCVEILARRFKVSVPERTKPRGRSLGDSPDIFLDMPEALRRKIGATSKSRGLSQQTLIVSVLREALDAVAA